MILSYSLPGDLLSNFTRTSGGDPANGSPHAQNERFYPHERGWSYGMQCVDIDTDILPARAGVILKLSHCFFDDVNFTRTSGGDPSDNNESDTEIMFYLHI